MALMADPSRVAVHRPLRNKLAASLRPLSTRCRASCPVCLPASTNSGRDKVVSLAAKRRDSAREP